MKPREQLARQTAAVLHGLVRDRRGAVKVITDNFNDYAIGRWVPVSERLPELDGFGIWEGYARLNNDSKSVEAGQWDEGLLEHTTHWLELELPEVEQ